MIKIAYIILIDCSVVLLIIIAYIKKEFYAACRCRIDLCNINYFALESIAEVDFFPLFSFVHMIKPVLLPELDENAML